MVDVQKFIQDLKIIAEIQSRKDSEQFEGQLKSYFDFCDVKSALRDDNLRSQIELADEMTVQQTHSLSPSQRLDSREIHAKREAGLAHVLSLQSIANDLKKGWAEPWVSRGKAGALENLTKATEMAKAALGELFQDTENPKAGRPHDYNLKGVINSLTWFFIRVREANVSLPENKVPNISPIGKKVDTFGSRTNPFDIMIVTLIANYLHILRDKAIPVATILKTLDAYPYDSKRTLIQRIRELRSRQMNPQINNDFAHACTFTNI